MSAQAKEGRGVVDSHVWVLQYFVRKVDRIRVGRLGQLVKRPDCQERNSFLQSGATQVLLPGQPKMKVEAAMCLARGLKFC